VTIELNGSRLTRTHPSQDPDRQSSSWDSIPVSEFGITKRERKESYVVRISCPGGGEEDAVISGVRLISDPSQLRADQLPQSNHKVIR